MKEMIKPNYWAELHDDPRALARIVKHDLDAHGVAMLQDFFTPKALEVMRQTADERYEYCLGSEVRKPLIGEDLLSTVFFQIAKSDWVQAISNPILRPFGYRVDKDDVYCAMNILHGAKSRDGIYGYHFDATLLTLAVPVVIPDPTSERRGSFRIWPNVRRFSTGWFQEKYYWRIMRIQRLRDRFRTFTVDFRPGNLYLFYGFRSWHGVDDLDETSLRVNCLINVGGPYFHKAKGKLLLPRRERYDP
jgi:hypothetical protein